MAECEGMVKDTVEAFGGIDIIIGNAVSLVSFICGSTFTHRVVI